MSEFEEGIREVGRAVDPGQIITPIVGAVEDIGRQLTGQAGAEAAREAAGIQAQAAVTGIEEQRRQFDISQQQLAPFREAGVGALQQQQALLGLLGPGQQQQAFAGLQESPGQQFLRQRQQRALLRGASAIGGLGGGNVRTALQQQAVGFGQQDIQNQLARLGQLTAGGQASAAGQAQIAGQQGANISNLLAQQAQAQAGGVLGAQQAQAGGTQNLLQAGLTTFALLSDRNMKEDINDLNLKECFDAVMSLPLKSWRYLEEAGIDRELHIGPMAQDAPEFIKVPGKEMLNVHNELMMIAGAIQYMKQEGLLNA